MVDSLPPTLQVRSPWPRICRFLPLDFSPSYISKVEEGQGGIGSGSCRIRGPRIQSRIDFFQDLKGFFSISTSSMVTYRQVVEP
jgi:hypothetical protein